MPSTETYEYGFIHALVIDAYNKDADGKHLDDQWVVLIEVAPDLVLDASNKSLLQILNEWGQDGWLISPGPSERVENNQIPRTWADVLLNHSGHLGLIRTRRSYWMSRKITWPDGVRQPPGRYRPVVGPV